MRRWWWLAGAVSLLMAAFLVASSGNPVRSLIGIVRSAEALAYLPPRRQVDLLPGPPQPPLTPGEAGMDPAAIESAMRYAEARNTTALVIGLNGHVVYQKFWQGTTLETDVDLSGFTPVLAALVLGTAQQNGEIRDLDAPLGLLVPEWVDDARGTITWRDLLTGNSNLAAPGARTWPNSLAARYHLEDDLAAQLLKWPQAERPDPAGSPAAVDAELMALALTRALGADYASLVRDRIWQPLGAGGFSMGVDGESTSRPQVRAGCCLRARIADWMRIGALIANRGVFEGNQLSPPAFANLMITPTHQGSSRAVFMRVDGQFAARDVVRLEAAGKQRLWMVPSLKLVILRVGAEPAAEQGWDEAMIPDSIIRGTRCWQPAGSGAGEAVDPNRYAPHR